MGANASKVPFKNQPNVDDYKDRLSLRFGLNPSEAIRNLVTESNKYSIDCAEFVQICIWYGMLEKAGNDATFNTYINTSVIETPATSFTKGVTAVYNKASFTLGNFNSTGIVSDILYQRGSAKEKFATTNGVQNQESLLEDNRTEDELLKAVPIGSRVELTNPKAKLGNAYQNENMIKVGDDQYAAFALDKSGNHASTNLYTLKEAKKYLAEYTGDKNGNNIYVSYIQTFQYEIPKSK